MEFNYLLTGCPAELNAIIQDKTLPIAEKIEHHINFLEKNPQSWEVMNSLAIAVFSEGDQDWALRIFDAALLIAPNQFSLIINKLTIQIKTNPVPTLYQLIELVGKLESYLSNSTQSHEVSHIQVRHPILYDLEFKILCCLIYAKRPDLVQSTEPVIQRIVKKYAYLFDTYDIIFYCAGYNHFLNIQPLVEHLKGSELKFALVLTHIESEQTKQHYAQLAEAYPNQVFIIERPHEIFLFQAKLCITAATPTLFNYGKPYTYQVVYVPHSISGIKGIYSIDSFLSCDFVFTSSEIQAREFLELKQAGFFSGQMTPFGYPKLSVLKQQLAHLPQQSEPNAIILAPFFTHEHNQSIVILPQYGLKIIETILKYHFQAILRPHPTSYNGEKVFGRAEDLDAIHAISKKFNSHADFILDQNPYDYLENYAKSKILITDFSGTALTYALLFERPVIFFRCPNQDEHYAQLSATNFELQSEYGIVVYSIEALQIAIIEICQNYALYQEKVRQFKQNFLFHADAETKQIFRDFLKPFFPTLS